MLTIKKKDGTVISISALGVCLVTFVVSEGVSYIIRTIKERRVLEPDFYVNNVDK